MLKRFFSFLRLKKVQSLPKILKNFPISFGTPVEISKQTTQITTDDEDLEGFLKAYEVLLTSIATNKLQDLEGSLEFNFLNKLQKSLNDLNSHGYKLKLSGNLNDTKIYSRSIISIIGPFLPFRNLIIPSSYYSIKKGFKDPLDIEYELKIKMSTFPPLDYEEFENFDFEDANKQLNQDFTQKMVKFNSVLNLINLKCEIEEIIYKTNFKLLVLDTDNKVVSGNDNDIPEMHTGVFEMFRIFKVIQPFYGKMKSDHDFFSKILKNYLDNYILIDFDSFMEGNPPIPKDLFN